VANTVVQACYQHEKELFVLVMRWSSRWNPGLVDVLVEIRNIKYPVLPSISQERFPVDIEPALAQQQHHLSKQSRPLPNLVEEQVADSSGSSVLLQAAAGGVEEITSPA
jgi:hypothetical protein